MYDPDVDGSALMPVICGLERLSPRPPAAAARRPLFSACLFHPAAPGTRYVARDAMVTSCRNLLRFFAARPAWQLRVYVDASVDLRATGLARARGVEVIRYSFPQFAGPRHAYFGTLVRLLPLLRGAPGAAPGRPVVVIDVDIEDFEADFEREVAAGLRAVGASGGPATALNTYRLVTALSCQPCASDTRRLCARELVKVGFVYRCLMQPLVSTARLPAELLGAFLVRMNSARPWGLYDRWAADILRDLPSRGNAKFRRKVATAARALRGRGGTKPFVYGVDELFLNSVALPELLAGDGTVFVHVAYPSLAELHYLLRGVPDRGALPPWAEVDALLEGETPWYRRRAERATALHRRVFAWLRSVPDAVAEAAVGAEDARDRAVARMLMSLVREKPLATFLRGPVKRLERVRARSTRSPGP